MAPKSVLLPVSDPPRDGGIDDGLFKGSAMSKRGAYAALSYMSCSGRKEEKAKRKASSADNWKERTWVLVEIATVNECRSFWNFEDHTLAIFFIICMIVLLVMFNKAALSSYNFPCANVITLFQMLTSTCILYAMKRWKIISFTVAEPYTASDAASLVPIETLLHTLPLSLAYLLYMTYNCGIYNDCGVSIDWAKVLIFYCWQVFISVALIVFGAFVAGARDLSFDAYGYSIVFIANFTTAIYLATIARVGKSSGLNSFGLMWCNGLICGPTLFFWTYIRGDLELAMNFPYLYSPGFQAVMLLSCIMAFFLNYSIFLNTTLNSAVTQTICGNLKDLFTVGFGWLLFGGLPFDLLNVIGQGLNFVGSGLYAYCKLKGR
ncbi:Nucleotide-sugar uncharacterized transporter 3 [Cocos nucifera]|uniref:Nucleotide-sugar uncharacterized transporter 3 n=1 Tax=Cocos nucifera TaxID=13894 RepID=A0A8K0INH3_COCNU|nr:Nucleotide-sugar uncharacterized transporter 3 [Cocos nucifera]